MAVAHVQAAQAVRDFQEDATLELAFPGNVTNGNTIVGAIWWGDAGGTTPTVSSIADNMGGTANTYDITSTGGADASSTDARFYLLTFVAPVTANTGACTVTVTFSSAGSNVARILFLHEVSGVAATSPIDKYASGNTNTAPGTDAVASPEVTTTTDGQYCFGVTIQYDGGQATTGVTAGTNWTAGTTVAAGDCMSAYRTQASAGALSALFSSPAGTYYYQTAIVTLKAGAAYTPELEAPTVAAGSSVYAATVKPNQLAHPDEDLADGGWKTYYVTGLPGNNVAMYMDIDDGAIANDNNMIRSAVAPSNDTVTFGLTSLLTPEEGTVKILVRAGYYP